MARTDTISYLTFLSIQEYMTLVFGMSCISTYHDVLSFKLFTVVVSARAYARVYSNVTEWYGAVKISFTFLLLHVPFLLIFVSSLSICVALVTGIGAAPKSTSTELNWISTVNFQQHRCNFFHKFKRAQKCLSKYFIWRMNIIFYIFYVKCTQI